MPRGQQAGVTRGPYNPRQRADAGSAKLARTLDRGTPPSPEERLRWAQMDLIKAIDLLEQYPNDRVMLMVVFRRKKELVALTDQLQDKRRPGYVLKSGGRNGTGEGT